jgi:hypothetical protein
LTLTGAKNTVYYHMLNLFSPEDYMETIIQDEDGETIKTKKFVTTSGTAKKRLDIIGYYLDSIFKQFQTNIEFLKENSDDYPVELYDILSEFHNYLEDIPKNDLIQNMTIENFNNAIKLYFDNPSSKIPTGNVVLDYIINYKKEHYGLGFPCLDHLCEVRVILDNLSMNSLVEYDLTEIIDNGYVEVEEVLSFWNTGRFDSISNKTIILTEGTTDIYVLKKSLNLLYPQYSHLYTFFDFDNTKSQGSTSSLVHLVKGFISAGIKDRMIALFDNDTATYEALSVLNEENLTANIKIIHLPNLKWAMDYPTLGPTGLVKADINKLACSMEFFMGKNLLIKSGDYIPVQWTGYNSKLKRYQGEILYKKEIHNKFFKIIKKAEKMGVENVDHDWEQLKYLWETIFSVYNNH